MNQGQLIKREKCLLRPAQHFKCNDYACGCWCHFRNVQFLGLSKRAKAKRFISKLNFGILGQDVSKIRIKEPKKLENVTIVEVAQLKLDATNGSE